MNQPATNEKELLQRVSRGDETSFRRLVYNYHTLLYGFIADLTRNREMAEEIVQDIFLQVWQSRESLDHIQNFRPYLFVMARNHALNALRSALRERKRFEKWQKTGATPEIDTDDQDHDPHPNKKQSVLMEAINRLPEKQQTARILSRRDGKKYTEIVEEMNIARDTVKRHIQLANVAIMKYLQQHIGNLVVLVIAAETLAKT